jgi:hypothetical protein
VHIIVTWNSGFSPQDARTLRGKHKRLDGKTSRIFFDRTEGGRGKTGIAVIGTLSPFGDYLVRRYLAELWGRAHGRVLSLPNANRRALRPKPPRKRAIVMPGDKRQLCDMRRSGVVETFTGGRNARDVAEKFGNTIDHSNVLFKTYNPVDLEKVRQAEAARLEGRRRKNKG